MAISLEHSKTLLPQIPFSWQQQAWHRLSSKRKDQTLAHAYLVTGSTGIGKLLFAEAFARTVLCLTPENEIACGQCSICQLAEGGALPDLLKIEPIDKSQVIKIDQIRAATDFISKSSHSGRGKVIIISAAHRLNTAAANALLKTLEEPTEATYILLVTELPGALSATIRSRCQRINLGQPNREESQSWLRQQLSPGAELDWALVNLSTQPLLALEASRTADFNLQSEFLDSINGVWHDPALLRSAVAQAVKLGDAASIGYLMEVSTILIKYLLTNTVPTELDSKMIPLIDSLNLKLKSQAAHKEKLSKNLLMLQNELQNSRRLMMSSANPNGQLVVESLLLRWSQVLN